MMDIFITIIAFLGVLAIIIIAHELGHFSTAKATGVKVEEFGIGFPPRLLALRRGETLYSLNTVPLGGFTKMAGEEDPSVPRSLASKGIATRLLVISAGSLMNFLLPILLFSIAFMVPHDMSVGPVTVEEVSMNSPAAIAGIEPGDVITSINDKPIRNIYDLHRYIQLNMGKEITMSIQHNDETTEAFQVVPRWKPPEGEGATGLLVNMPSVDIIRESEPFWRAIPMGTIECVETFVLFKNEIMSWFVRGVAPPIAGPVGIAQITGEVAKAGISPLLEFAAFLSINIGLINLFPLPALDGGRIVFVLLEWIRRGKRISPRTEGRIHAAGFVLLIAAMLAVTYRDIIRIIAGESLIQ